MTTHAVTDPFAQTLHSIGVAVHEDPDSELWFYTDVDGHQSERFDDRGDAAIAAWCDAAREAMKVLGLDRMQWLSLSPDERQARIVDALHPSARAASAHQRPDPVGSACAYGIGRLARLLPH